MHFCDAPLNFTVFDLNFYRSKDVPTHLYTWHNVFPALFWGMYWSVGNSDIIVGACRRLVLLTSRLLPVSVHVPLATTVEKIVNITRYSHITSWNAWLDRTTVRLHWTASKCNYCIHYHASLIPPRTSTPGTHEIQLAITRSLCDDTTPCYFRGTEVRLVLEAADKGYIALKTENSSTW